MDTLPLNGNHGNNYSVASGDYLSDSVQILERGGVSGYSTYSNHKETTLEKQILKELTSNYAPSYLNNHQRSATTERNHNLMNKMVNIGNGTGNNLGLEIIREESNAPLLPPRPLESFFPLLTNEHTDETPQSPNHRNSLYTSMPVLTDLPDGQGSHGQMNGLAGNSSTGSVPGPEADDVYYKSMPNLGSRNHLHQLHHYYQMGRGGSDGYMVPVNKEDSDSSPEEPLTPVDPSHLVTSL
uniref:GPCR family 2 latrophilin C-terminal domain-containing protein n=1 Tax=Hucho hucho TaxID=62062 RepID=A0A4W5L227_9TELE